MMTRAKIEAALDQHQLEVAMTNGRWWKLRRNGRTQTWKTRPGQFRIPVKAGLNSYTAITDLNMADAALFRIKDHDKALEDWDRGLGAYDNKE